MIDFAKTIAKSFDQDFCQHLEYYLSSAFENSRTNKFEYFWCDGIEVPEVLNQCLENFSKVKKVLTGAWLGVNGQDKYTMTIKLGNDSLQQCMRGQSLLNCLPNSNSLDWINLDTENKTIVLSFL